MTQIGLPQEAIISCLEGVTADGTPECLETAKSVEIVNAARKVVAEPVEVEATDELEEVDKTKVESNSPLIQQPAQRPMVTVSNHHESLPEECTAAYLFLNAPDRANASLLSLLLFSGAGEIYGGAPILGGGFALMEIGLLVAILSSEDALLISRAAQGVVAVRLISALLAYPIAKAKVQNMTAHCP